MASSLFGLDYDFLRRLDVWAKGTPIPNFDSAVWRWDAFGTVMRFADHGDRSSDYGWEFDHYPIPKSQGGSDDISNLRPLNWRNNASLGNKLGR